MNVRTSAVLASFGLATLAALAGCSHGSSTAEELAKNGGGTSKSASGTEPDDDDGEKKDGSGTSSDGASGTTLGPECTAYLACCDEVAAQMPQLAASCDSTRKAIEDAQAKGASTASYESACKSGTSGFVSAGYCK